MSEESDDQGFRSATSGRSERVEGGEFQTGRVAAIAGGHAVHDTYTAFLPPLLPQFVSTFSLTNTAAGWLSAFLQIPSLLQPVIGHLADRTTLRWIVVLGPGVTATLMSFLGWAPGYFGLALLLFLAGLSVAAFHSTAPVAIGYLSGNKLGRGMGFWMVGGELGRTLGPLVVVTALAVMSLKSMAWLALAGIATSIFLHFFLRNAGLRSRGDHEEVPWRDAVRAMSGFMVLMAGLIAVRSLSIMAMTVFLPLLLTAEGASVWIAGASLSIVEAAGVAGAFAGGWLSDHLGRRAVLLFGHIVTPAALALFLVADDWARVALLPVIGFALLAIPPVLMAMVQERHPESRALANGVFLSLNFIIRSIAAVGYGILADAVGLPTAVVVAAVAMLLGLPLIMVLFRSPE